jgi:Mn2+/Fe2+ NRAMP family transporter
VAAAFIGPGTVTTATLAGAQFGVALLWALVFATLATIVLQEMSARLGLVSGRGLSEALAELAPPWGRGFAWLAGLAVVSGVVAFEAGNLTGAGLGLDAVTGVDRNLWITIVAVIAAGLLWMGRYRLLERVLVTCVALMGVLFVVTAILVRPDLSELAAGALMPTIPAGAAGVILALIGTTIVPYNLFLHAHAVQARWQGAADLSAARRDLILAIGLGGVVSVAIVVTAAALDTGTVESATDMAHQLEPLLGDWARVTFGLGFGIAGITSAITAPLAAAYIVGGLMGGGDLKSGLARTVAIVCVGVGAGVAVAGVRPVQLIFLAQIANGIILPLVVAALILVVNDRTRLGHYANGVVLNLVGSGVVAVCVLLAIRSCLS